LSPSLNSKASLAPVDAPEGTLANPYPPKSVQTSTSTVGIPRESKISRPKILTIFDIYISLFHNIG
jgi:hypothetical protein